MSLSTYLATKYLNADSPSATPRSKKKRKRAHDGDFTSLTITDDNDDLSLSRSVVNEDEHDRPVIDSSNRSAEFRKAKKNNWKILNAPTPASSKPTPADQDSEAADEILKAAALESEARRDADVAQDAPTIVGHDVDTPRMESGARAGLQTAADTRAMVELQRQRKEREKGASLPTKEQQETVYRDATGRRIDVQLRRAEARKAEEEAKKKKRKEIEKRGGDVQKQEQDERRKQLEDARLLTLARGEDDEEMNKQLMSEDRWGDPMLKYLAKDEPTSHKKGTGGRPQKPTYQGGAQPNRYGIRPGFRWDGVDRGNGFEKEWFQARGRKERQKGLEYQWQMDE